jgi:hypothetical protein
MPVISGNEVWSTRNRRGRYPRSRSSVRTDVMAGRFPKPVQRGTDTAALTWASEVLDIYDALRAAGHAPERATALAEQAAANRAAKALREAGVTQ